MKKTMSVYDFTDYMMSIRPDNFTAKGLDALYDYLTDCEEGCAAEMEFDAIAICCDFSEDSIKNHLENYSLQSIEELEEHTTVLRVDDNNIIIQNY